MFVVEIAEEGIQLDPRTVPHHEYVMDVTYPRQTFHGLSGEKSLLDTGHEYIAKVWSHGRAHDQGRA
jgi:hypothetical protein